MDRAREVWGKARNLLSERRVTLSMATHVVEHAERLAVEFEEMVKR